MKPKWNARRFAGLLWEFLSSVKLAVVVMAALLVSLAAATFLESAYDTPTAQYLVYRSGWFAGVLAFLGVNIFCSALSRWPWQRRHAAFLLAHLGILMMLGGALVTDLRGIDGMLRVTEGETTGRLEISDRHFLVVVDGAKFQRVLVPWLPPDTRFKPISLRERGLPYDLTVTDYLSHADMKVQVLPAPELTGPAAQGVAAVQLVVQGGPMRIRQEYWLWQGDVSLAHIEAGPAILQLRGGRSDAARPEARATPGRTVLKLRPAKDGSISFEAISSVGAVKKGVWSRGVLAGVSPTTPLAFDPGWKQVKILVQRVYWRARAEATYVPAQVQYGMRAPQPAIRLVASDSNGRSTGSLWLGLGDRASLSVGSREVGLAYMPQTIQLPFQVRLERFTIQHYEGSMDPSSYASRVSVLSRGKSREVEISMNEPLQEGGFTVYQSSYEDAQPRPITSIFSVNQDPGRGWKYMGSVLIVLGTMILFWSRFQGARKARGV